MRITAAMAAGILLGLMAATAGAATPAGGGFQNFITRDGDKLMDGAKQFRFVGANMPGMILPYDFTQRIPERMTLATPWEQEDAFRTCVQMNLRAVRWWNLPMRGPTEAPQPWHYVLEPGKFNEEAFKTIDSALVLANKYGVRVVFALSAEAGNYLGGVNTYAAWRKKTTKDFWTNPELKEDFKATLRYVVNRKNSLSGVPYKDEKAILCWEFGNELRSGPDAWQSEMAAYLKSLDANHLIMDAYDKRKTVTIDPNIDILNRHYYGGDWVKNVRADWAPAKGKRPLVIAECGLTDNPPAVAAFLDEIIETGPSGAMIWSMYFHREAGGFVCHQIFTHPAMASYHWPGFPSGAEHKEREMLQVLRNGAFKIQGLPVPPMPVPEPAPVLLPVGDVPQLSWRGSTGALAYDIERAPAVGGPWTVVAKDVSDADVAYRPLWNDESARAGDTWFYRVTGHNESGRTAASNVVGPVKVREACLVDECKDLAHAAAKSDGLKIVNDHNGMYAEYMFRAKGDKGDFLVYKAPGAISKFKVSAWYGAKPAGAADTKEAKPAAPKDAKAVKDTKAAKPAAPPPAPVSDMVLQASADGKTFTDVKAERMEKFFKSSAGDLRGASRTLVEYEGAAPAGSTYFKVLWTGPTEVDRVELYNAGGAAGK